MRISVSTFALALGPRAFPAFRFSNGCVPLLIDGGVEAQVESLIFPPRNGIPNVLNDAGEVT